MTTKILALTDALGNLVRFVLLPGHRFDTVGVPPLIGALIADKAFDSNAIAAEFDERGAKVVIHDKKAGGWIFPRKYEAKVRAAVGAEGLTAPPLGQDQTQQTLGETALTGPNDGRASTTQIDAAAAEAHPEPTEAQKEAGNYRKGHARWNGLDLTIENAKGSERRGKGPDGTEWSVTMPAHYGYFKGTEASDGDHVDFYMGDKAPHRHRPGRAQDRLLLRRAPHVSRPRRTRPDPHGGPDPHKPPRCLTPTT